MSGNLFETVISSIYSTSTRQIPNTNLRRLSSPYCCWSLWWISADGTFSPTRNLITIRCSTFRGTFFSLITLATTRQDWTGSNPSRREGRGCGFTLSRSHNCCAVRLVYIQISPGHIWTTLYYSRAVICDTTWMNELSVETVAVRGYCLLTEVSASFILFSIEVINLGLIALNLIAVKFKISEWKFN